jgi:hypothetical protein
VAAVVGPRRSRAVLGGTVGAVLSSAVVGLAVGAVLSSVVFLQSDSRRAVVVAVVGLSWWQSSGCRGVVRSGTRGFIDACAEGEICTI